MALFNEAVLTQKGIDLLAKVQAEHATMQITKAVSGAGEYEEGEDLVSRTALKDKRQEFAPTTIRRQNDSNVFVNFTITNYDAQTKTGLTQGYKVTEIGLMATDPDEGEILYAIATAIQADYLQPYNGLLPATMGVSFLIVVDNADNVTITTDLEAYATTEDLATKGDSLGYDSETGRLSLKANGVEISHVIIIQGGGSGSIATEEEVDEIIDTVLEEIGDIPEEDARTATEEEIQDLIDELVI